MYHSGYSESFALNTAMKDSSCLANREVKSLSRVQLFVTPWTVAYQVPLSMWFPRQEYWSGLPFSLPGDLPDPELNSDLLHCRQTLYHWAAREAQISCLKLKVKIAQSCPILCCDPMDYTVHGILQAKILEWGAFPFSRGSSQPRDQPQVSRIAGRFFTSWSTREAHFIV